MKKFLLICSIAAISSAFGALCKEVVDPCPPKESEPETTSCDECACTVYVPPALVVPEHSLNVVHSLQTICHDVEIEHLPFTPPPIDSLFCNCNPPETPAPEEGKKCVVEPEPEGLCPRPASSKSVGVDGAYGSPIAPFTSAQVLNGICRTADGQLQGTLELKVGKRGKNGTLKVAGKIIGVSGKKLSARAVTVSVGVGNAFDCVLAFGGAVGDLPITVDANSAIPLASVVSSSGCAVQSCLLGGEIRNGSVELQFSTSTTAAWALPQGFATLLDESSWDVAGIISKGTTLKFAKAASPKVVRAAEGFAIVGLDAENVRGLKLRYSRKTGVLKGDYTIYASDIDVAAGKPKLKKFKMKLGGFVFNGLGNGVVVAPDGTSFGAFTLQ